MRVRDTVVPLAVCWSLVIGSSACAQVTVRATAGTDLVVRAVAGANPPVEQRIARGTDVSSGFNLSAWAWSGGATSAASSALTLRHGIESSIVEFHEQATAHTDTLGTGATGLFGPHTLEIVYRSPVAIPASLQIVCCAGATVQVASYAGQLSVNGTPRFNAPPGTTWASCLSGQFPNQLTVPVVVDPAGLRIEVSTRGTAVDPSLAIGRWRLTLTPDPDFPCAVTRYGTPCGATLASVPDLRFPGMQRLTLTDPSLPPAAFLAVGLQRGSIPLLGCSLLTDNLIVVPWEIDVVGTATTLFAPPPVPGLVLTAQGGTFGAAFHTSNGLEVVCP